VTMSPPPPASTSADERIQLEVLGPDIERTRPSNQKKEFLRLTGKSFLPFARVQKILKADRELPLVTKDATHLISIACEEFIKMIMTAAHKLAKEDQRPIVKHHDLAIVVRRVDRYLFLTEIIPWESNKLPPQKMEEKAKSDLPEPHRTKNDDDNEKDLLHSLDGSNPVGTAESDFAVDLESDLLDERPLTA